MRRPILGLGVLLAALAPAAAAAAAAVTAAVAVAAADDSADDGAIVPREWLVIEAVDAGGRRPFRPDRVFLRYLLDPGVPPPSEGDEETGERGTRTWKRVEAGADGRVPGPVGWAHTTIESDADRVMLMDAPGARAVFVNGSGHVGDLYGLGYGPVPVALRAGSNPVYVHCRHGSSFGFTLRPAQSELVISTRDATVPHLVVDAGRQPNREQWASVLVMNASTERIPALDVVAGGNRRFPTVSSEPGHGLMPLALGKVAVPFEAPFAEALDRTSRPSLRIRVSERGGDRADETLVPLQVRRPDEPRILTFRSGIDGTVQEFSIRPPAEGGRDLRVEGRLRAPTSSGLSVLARRGRGGESPVGRDGGPGLVLSLHGAGVHSINQARAYSAHPGLWIVAPTNRRPFGFDWQDWGRLDAYEVLAVAEDAIRPDPRRRYLTGHSMGGHGAWHLAANDPDAFAAVAPSAGWSSFDSYGSRPEGALREWWHRADATSRTLDLVQNLAQVPAYVLHGDADDNVPASEARSMIAALEAAGAAPRSHFQPGAGHWWDGDAAPGADCVDWPGLFELFEESRRPEPSESTSLRFVCADPGADASHLWVRLEQPFEYGRPMEITAAPGASGRVESIVTRNVRRVTLKATAPLAERWTLDGATFAGGGPATYERPSGDGSWRRIGDREWHEIHWTQKRPDLMGPFKRAFERHFVLVVPTVGTAAENEESLRRARHDAQVWWYRGNGNARILRDVALVGRGDRWERAPWFGDNVILYGNADTNLAWVSLLGEDGPVSVGRGRLEVGDHRWTGDDLGAVFVRPGRGWDDAEDSVVRLVGAVASTGVAGDRVGYTLASFVSGVGYPDYTAFSSRVLTEGDGGVLAAGWFDHAWALDGRGYVDEDAPELDR